VRIHQRHSHQASLFKPQKQKQNQQKQKQNKPSIEFNASSLQSSTKPNALENTLPGGRLLITGLSVSSMFTTKNERSFKP
jgi:hypothetical protein